MQQAVPFFRALFLRVFLRSPRGLLFCCLIPGFVSVMFCFMIHVIPDTIRIFLFWLVFVVLFQSGTRVRRHFISLRTYTPGTKNCDNFRVLPRPFDPRPQQLHTGYHGYEYMPRINSWNNPWNNPYGHWVCCYRRFKIAPKPLGNR